MFYRFLPTLLLKNRYLFIWNNRLERCAHPCSHIYWFCNHSAKNALGKHPACCYLLLSWRFRSFSLAQVFVWLFGVQVFVAMVTHYFKAVSRWQWWWVDVPFCPSTGRWEYQFRRRYRWWVLMNVGETFLWLMFTVRKGDAEISYYLCDEGDSVLRVDRYRMFEIPKHFGGGTVFSTSVAILFCWRFIRRHYNVF